MTVVALTARMINKMSNKQRCRHSLLNEHQQINIDLSASQGIDRKLSMGCLIIVVNPEGCWLKMLSDILCNQLHKRILSRNIVSSPQNNVPLKDGGLKIILSFKPPPQKKQ